MAKRAAAVYVSVLLVSVFLLGRAAKPQDIGMSPTGTQPVQIPVMVRDSSGKPVSGLSADDFVISERGQRRSVTMLPRAPSSGGQITYVLILIAPMSSTGRENALRAISHSLSKGPVDHLQFALLDSSGTYTPFTEDVQKLKTTIDLIAKKVDPPQYPGGPWLPAAGRSIEELGLMAGRRAVVAFTDYESKSMEAYFQNPNLLRVDPMMLVGAALRARAAIYAVQTSGPTPVVPFGSAASSQQYSASGPELLGNITSETASLGALRSNLLYAASLTGGLPANGMTEALRQIRADAEGYYLLSFIPDPLEEDGGWHSLSVTTRFTQLKVSAIHFYLAPLNSRGVSNIPSILTGAMRSDDQLDDLPITLGAWLFPSHPHGVYSLAVGADIALRSPQYGVDAGSTIELYAQLRNETFNVLVASWHDTFAGPRTDQLLVHWQDETSVFPGTYTLKLVAMDRASQRFGSKTFRFLVHSAENQAIPASAIVLSNSCFASPENPSKRRDLLDPLQWRGCELAPTPSSSFLMGKPLNVLLRLYPRSPQISNDLLHRWNAHLVIDETDTEVTQVMPLSITSDDVAGVAVFGTVDLTALGTSAGSHKVKIVLSGPKDQKLIGETGFNLLSPISAEK